AVTLLVGGVLPPADQSRTSRQDLREPGTPGVEGDADSSVSGQSFGTPPLVRAQNSRNPDNLGQPQQLAVVVGGIGTTCGAEGGARAVLAGPQRRDDHHAGA